MFESLRLRSTASDGPLEFLERGIRCLGRRLFVDLTLVVGLEQL